MRKNLVLSIALCAICEAPYAAAQETGTATSAARVSPEPAPMVLPPPLEKQKVEVTAAPGKGITVAAGDAYSATLRFRVQARGTVRNERETTTSEVNISTVRVALSGNVISPKINYTLQLALGGNDFETGSSTPLFDAYVDFKQLRDASLRVGQFFVPFDRARTVREFALQTVSRAQVISELALDRDMGVMLFSDDLGGLGSLSYRAGIFGGDGRNRFGAPSAGFLYVGRVSVRPFGAFDDDQEADLERSDKFRLAVGAAVAYNASTDRQRSTVGSIYQAAKFDYGHAAGDLVAKWNGLSLLVEGITRWPNQSIVEGTTADGKTVREYSRRAWGVVAQAGYMLTSGFEVWGRYDRLVVPDGTDPKLVDLEKKAATEIGGGLNYYLNGHLFKIQADYARLFGDSFSEAANLVRLQLDATF
jgi:hypothetical protein